MYCKNCGLNLHTRKRCLDCDDDSDDALLNMGVSVAVGAVTGSALLGGLVGGDFIGGALGDILEGGGLFD